MLIEFASHISNIGKRNIGKCDRKRIKGFTLIELMIVVAIVGILAAVVLPSYRDSIRKSKRTDVQGALVNFANAMERFFTQNNFSYVGSVDAGGVPNMFPSTAPLDGGSPQYTLRAVVTPSTYVLTATPIAGTSQEGTGALTLDNTGAQTWNGNPGWR